MEEFGDRKNVANEKSFEAEGMEETDYPASIEKMSEQWRSIQRQNPDQQTL